MIRQLKLYNAKKEVIDLTNNQDFLGFNPQGLGVSFSNGFYGANANFLQTGNAINQNQLELTIMIGYKSHQAYKKFYQLIQFLNHAPYLFEYQTDAGKFHRECILSELTKTELKEEGTLQETLILDFTTPYFKTVKGEVSLAIPIVGKAGKIYQAVSEQKEGEQSGLFYDKVYDYDYSVEKVTIEYDEYYYTYDYTYDDADIEQNGVIVVDNQSVYLGSSAGSPCEITITGEASNPHWQVVQGSRVVQSDGFNLDIPKDYRLIVSSVPQEQRAVLIAPDGTTSNVWQQQDFSKSNFVTFPTGESRIIFFNCRKAEITYREESVVV